MTYNFTVAQVAAQWRVSERTVYSLCATGELCHLRISKQIRIRPQDVADYEARQWRGPATLPHDLSSPCEAKPITNAPALLEIGGNPRIYRR